MDMFPSEVVLVNVLTASFLGWEKALICCICGFEGINTPTMAIGSYNVLPLIFHFPWLMREMRVPVAPHPRKHFIC